MLSKSNKIVVYACEKGYRVSKDGDVISPEGSVRKLWIKTNGYYGFSIYYKNDKKSRDLLVHQLQAYQLFGKKIFNKDVEIRHLDGNTLNNKAENLSFGNRHDNIMDIPLKKRSRMAKNAGRANSSLTKSDVKDIRSLREEQGYTYKQLIEKYPMSKSTVARANDQHTGLGILFKPQDLTRMTSDKRFQLIGGTIADTQPENLWGKTFEQDTVSKVSVLRNNRKGMIPCVLPQEVILSFV